MSQLPTKLLYLSTIARLQRKINYIYMELKHQIKKIGIAQNYNSSLKEQKVVENQQFYSTLAHYSTLCGTSQNIPTFLQNRDSSSVTIMIIIFDVLSILENICMWHIIQQASVNAIFFKIILWINCIFLLLMNVFYILAIKLNPGIINLSKISDQIYEEHGKQFCIYCQQYRTYQMYHCIQCGVCIQNYDHHCKILNRCIGGKQKRAFVCFIYTLGLSFSSLIVCGVCTLIEI